MKTLTTKCGATVMVDDADYDEVSQYRWRIVGGYVTTNVWDSTLGKPVYRPLHRMLMQAAKGVQVDHRDRNKLNCTRANLRFCTALSNAANKTHRPHSSRYHGVTWHRAINKWQAAVQCRGKKHYLGVFTDEAEAGRAYDAAALGIYGEFASLNFPEEAAA